MVRALVATMLKVGRNKTNFDNFRTIIESQNCTLADFSSPPNGLFLAQVAFPSGYFD
jgi:tRNA pseudouridine38-40 synthase